MKYIIDLITKFHNISLFLQRQVATMYSQQIKSPNYTIVAVQVVPSLLHNCIMWMESFLIAGHLSPTWLPP